MRAKARPLADSGFNLGAITNAYATGNVTGGSDSIDTAGGIAGTNNGAISNVYATGTITGAAGQVGALVGNNTAIVEENTGPPDFNDFNVTVNYVITNGYWNADTMGSASGSSGVGTLNGGGGMTTAQMQDIELRAITRAFRFNTIWAPPNQANQGCSGTCAANYPQLYALSHIVWVSTSNSTVAYGTTPALSDTLIGLHNYDLPSVVQGLVLSSAGGSSPEVGSYAISENGATATSTDGSTYRFVTTGTLTVDPLALSGTATIIGINKPYDGTAAAAGGSAALNSLNGVINGDSVSLSATSGTYANGANAGGTETVNLTGVMLTGSKSGDYTLGSLTYSGSGQITPATLTVSGTKIYDATTGFALNQLAIAGGANGETVTLTSGTGTSTSANVGTYAGSSLSGLADQCYWRQRSDVELSIAGKRCADDQSRAGDRHGRLQH